MNDRRMPVEPDHVASRVKKNTTYNKIQSTESLHPTVTFHKNITSSDAQFKHKTMNLPVHTPIRQSSYPQYKVISKQKNRHTTAQSQHFNPFLSFEKKSQRVQALQDDTVRYFGITLSIYSCLNVRLTFGVGRVTCRDLVGRLFWRFHHGRKRH